MYAIEKAASLKTTAKSLDLVQRKKLILDFLDLIEFFDKSIDAEVDSGDSMQICDVKLDNFGLNKHGELKVIDTDMVHLDKTIFNGDVCRKHDDCHYFDCKSFCNLQTKKCEMKRVDNNLQVICEKIFSNPFFPNEGLITGVKLKNEKLKNDLDQILNKCIEPGYYKLNESNNEDGQRVKTGASHDIIIEMINLFNTNQFN